MGSPDRLNGHMPDQTDLDHPDIVDVLSESPGALHDEPDPIFLQLLKDAGVDSDLLLPTHSDEER